MAQETGSFRLQIWRPTSGLNMYELVGESKIITIKVNSTSNSYSAETSREYFKMGESIRKWILKKY